MSGSEDVPHAALLIDFDNVTMGMRSDLAKELKSLLDTDVIKGKVSVQRAYADWRRYPQYIVPLSEASVDLIYAPAYGSNKKNATDIRMAIDALELIFIRPEIMTYILLTGDADFSSLVLKLKEYGKYVIGVGIQESSSDILVQNCHEYYSYTSLTGLTKTTELGQGGGDPWVLVRDAVAKMTQRGDVMRSDRLKQVMQEIDPSFDEGAIGFSKFSKFMAEAASRGLVKLQKMENGQYEIAGVKGGGGRSRSRDEGRGRRDRGRGGRRGGRDRGPRSEESRAELVAQAGAGADAPTETGSDANPIDVAYGTLRQALTALKEAGRDPVRDSDVKRRMLEIRRGFDETELGFPKFSKFLEQAVEDGVVRTRRSESGNVEVSLAEGSEDTGGRDDTARADTPSIRAEAPDVPAPSAVESAESAVVEPTVEDVEPPKRGLFGFRLGPRRGSTRRRPEDESSSMLTGGPREPRAPAPSDTSAAPSDTSAAPSDTSSDPSEVSSERESTPVARQEAQPDAAPAHEEASPTTEAPREASSPNMGSDVDFDSLGLPSESGAMVRYLTHRYKGVGEKTAETLVEAFGADLFKTMQNDPGAIARTVPPKRAEQVLEAWQSDFERRTARS
jgi:uncharacterized protein (TIGR00288 family)